MVRIKITDANEYCKCHQSDEFTGTQESMMTNKPWRMQEITKGCYTLLDHNDQVIAVSQNLDAVDDILDAVNDRSDWKNAAINSQMMFTISAIINFLFVIYLIWQKLI